MTTKGLAELIALLVENPGRKFVLEADGLQCTPQLSGTGRGQRFLIVEPTDDFIKQLLIKYGKDVDLKRFIPNEKGARLVDSPAWTRWITRPVTPTMVKSQAIRLHNPVANKLVTISFEVSQDEDIVFIVPPKVVKAIVDC